MKALKLLLLGGDVFISILFFFYFYKKYKITFKIEKRYIEPTNQTVVEKQKKKSFLED